MIANAITEIREIAIRMERFLSISDDPMELAALVVPDYYGHFYWNEKTRIEARSVFALSMSNPGKKGALIMGLNIAKVAAARLLRP